MRNRLSAAILAALLVAGCQQQSEPESVATETQTTDPAPVVAEAPAPAKELGSGIDMAGFNTDVRAQDDFYEYVNGTWMEETEIPADKSNYGAFTKLADDAEKNLQALVQDLSAEENAPEGSAAQKIRDFYNSYVDVDAATEKGAAAIQAELDAIQAAANLDDVYSLFAELSKYGVNSPFGGGIFSDAKDPDTNVVWLVQAGTTLPDRDYYLKDDENFVKGRDLFRTYMTGIFSKLGMEDAEARADRLLALETRFAEVQWTKEQNRDSVAIYNPKSHDEVKAMAPKINWDLYLETAGIPAQDRYIVNQPSFYEAADDIIADTPVDVWKDYLTFQTVSSFAQVMGQEYFDMWFDFARRGLAGVEEPRPPWKRAIASINGNMGEIVGQAYVDRHFRPEAKERMVTMVDNLKAAYGESITNLDWMSDATKAEAHKKLAGFYTKIGYPDEWRDYSTMGIVEGDLITNIKSAADFEYRRQLSKLDKPVDKEEWFMNPQTVNAYYNPIWNEIVFPAAILQPPFFNVDADDAVNYGGIGAVIGHEIGHGFDDQGRNYDGDGVLRNWWTDEDDAKFTERKNKLAAQYDAYEVINGKTINGQFTSGENIGDLGGLSIAYKAYKMSLNGEEAPVIDGLTGDQRFFMGWAQVWRRLYRDAELERRLTTDPHSPSKARTNVVLKNIPEFYAAFDIQEGDAMYLPPEERVKIW